MVISRREFLIAAAAAYAMWPNTAYAGPRSCGAPRQAAPQRRKGGESLPPLPLPATPMRRTEKKRPPSPPALVGKLEYGAIKWGIDERGQRYSYKDWTTDPADMQNLLKRFSAALHQRYREQQTAFDRFSYNPAEIPILYLTGHEGFELDDKSRGEMRRFYHDGGTLVGDACCGSQEYLESLLKESEIIMPERALRPIPQTDPIFHLAHDIASVELLMGGLKDSKPTKRETIMPRLHGYRLGCRWAEIFTPHDLSCGWDGHVHGPGTRIDIDDARNLGENLLFYALGNHSLGTQWGTQFQYFQQGEPTRDQINLVKIVHSGDYDPNPSAIGRLLKHVASETTAEVKFEDKKVDLQKNPRTLFEYPAAYITGHDDFRFSDGEIATLRAYLSSGGVLIGEACCGSPEFDNAFRREIESVTGKPFQAVPHAHPLYTTTGNVRQSAFTDYAVSKISGLKKKGDTILEGITAGNQGIGTGQLSVIYSRLGLGWDGLPRPFSIGYEPKSGLDIGKAALTYSMMHACKPTERKIIPV